MEHRVTMRWKTKTFRSLFFALGSTGACCLSAFLHPRCQLLPVLSRDQRQQAPRAQDLSVRAGLAARLLRGVECRENFSCPRVPVWPMSHVVEDRER